MKIVKKLSMATAGAAFIALGVSTTVPATAASLDFSFTAESGITGFFTLNTDAALDYNPPLFGPDGGPYPEGFAYTSAITNLSISTPNLNLSSVTGDYSVYPSLPFGSTDGRWVYSAANFPAGCITATDVECLVGISIFYSGRVSELPILSEDPLSYAELATRIFSGVEVDDPTTGRFLGKYRITNLQVIPEPDSALGILAFGIGGTLLLLKNRMNKEKQR